MNIFKPFALVLLLIAAVSCSTPQKKPLFEAELRQRIARVQLGMLRSEVAPLFPTYSEPCYVMIGDGPTRRRILVDRGGAFILHMGGGGQVEFYCVSSEWRVRVPYDYSKPEPKVSGPVTLERVTQ